MCFGVCYPSVYYSGRSSDIWPTKTDPCPVKTKHDRSLCPVKISWKSVGAPIIHQHSDSVAMRDWEKDFSLWMHRTSLTSDRDKFNKRAGRWLVFWPTRNDGGKGSVSQLERSVVKLKFRSPVSTEQLLFLFTACARSLVTTRTRQPLFDLGPKRPPKDKEWHIIVLQHRWLRSTNPHRDCAHTGKLDLQRRRIDVHVTYLYLQVCRCAGMTLYARLPTLHAGRSPKSAAAPCRILKTDHPDPGPGAPFFFFFFFFFWSTDEIWAVTDQIWPVTDQIWIVTDHASDHFQTLIICCV